MWATKRWADELRGESNQRVSTRERRKSGWRDSVGEFPEVQKAFVGELPEVQNRSAITSP
jgi:hypothetical protein